MLIEVQYRIRAAPGEHLGTPSLLRLESFDLGYSLFPFKKTKGFSPQAFKALREWVIALYRPDFGTCDKSAISILLNLAPDDGTAFDLYFKALDSLLAAQPEILANLPDHPPAKDGFEPLPVSGFLNVLTTRPGLYLPVRNAACLRAFLDGYSLAAMEEGHFECLDLEGFEHWVRVRYHVMGMFRWENVILARCRGDESVAFETALTELKEYRASKNPHNERHFEVVVHTTDRNLCKDENT
jgi:hypothetical protein